MSQLKSLQHRNLILAGVALVLVVILVLRPSASSIDGEDAWQRQFPDFEPDLAQRIAIHQEGDAEQDIHAKTITLVLKGEGEWVLESHFGYRASPIEVANLLDSVGEMRVRKLVTTHTETFHKYAGHGGFTEVAIFARDGSVLATFALGKPADKHPEVFTRVGTEGNEQILQTIKVTSSMVSPEVSSWVDARLWPGLRGELMTRLDVKHADGPKLVIAKRGELEESVGLKVPEASEAAGATFWVMEPVPGADADEDKASNLGRFFTGLRLTNIAGAMQGDAIAEFGFSPPSLEVTYWQRTDHVLKSTLRIGNKTPDGLAYYVVKEDLPYILEVPSYTLSSFFDAPETFKVTPPEPVDDGDSDGDPDGDPDKPGGDADKPGGDADKPGGEDGSDDGG